MLTTLSTWRILVNVNLLPIPETTEALLQVHDRLSEWLNGPVAIRREPLIGELRPDALLEADDITFIVEYSRKTDVVSLERAIHLLGAVEAEMDSSSHVVPLLVVPYLSKQARDLCEQNRIHCVDLSGNATIRARGKHSALIVEIAGKQNRYETRGRPGNTFAPKASRLPRFMLSNVRSSFRQITIAEETGLDPGYVSRLVKNLIAAR